MYQGLFSPFHFLLFLILIILLLCLITYTALILYLGPPFNPLFPLSSSADPLYYTLQFRLQVNHLLGFQLLTRTSLQICHYAH